MNAIEIEVLEDANDYGAVPNMATKPAIKRFAKSGYLTSDDGKAYFITDQGFEALLIVRAEAKQKRLTEKAKQLGVEGNLALAEYIEKLELSIASLERTVKSLCDQNP